MIEVTKEYAFGSSNGIVGMAVFVNGLWSWCIRGKNNLQIGSKWSHAPFKKWTVDPSTMKKYTRKLFNGKIPIGARLAVKMDRLINNEV